MIISKTPLRASLFGGGSDFRAYFENSRLGYGSVLSVGLDMRRAFRCGERINRQDGIREMVLFSCKALGQAKSKGKQEWI